MPYVAGTKSTFDSVGTGVIEIADGLKFLNPGNNGIGFLKRIQGDDFKFNNHLYKWRETALAVGREIITITNVATTLNVADAYQYQVSTILKSENEIMRVTAIASATSLTVVRGYAGTTAAAHTAVDVINLGTARPEGADALGGVNDNGLEYFNYDQIFERGVSLTNHEIAALSSGGDKLPDQLVRRQLEMWKQMARAVYGGVRSQDTLNKIYTMGGLTQFVTTNVVNAAGAPPSIDMIDDVIQSIILAGGKVKTISCHPIQKRRLDALDANLVRIGKREDVAGAKLVGGRPAISTWRSGLQEEEIDIIVDHEIPRNIIHLNDTDYLEFGTFTGTPDEPGGMHIVNPTTNGANRKDQTIRSTNGFRVWQEKTSGYVYNLAP